jgi:hypothetical protein
MHLNDHPKRESVHFEVTAQIIMPAMEMRMTMEKLEYARCHRPAWLAPAVQISPEFAAHSSR